MKSNHEQALYDYLVSEYNHHFDFWDWFYLEGRRVEVSTEPKQWDYTETVLAAMKRVQSVLDMRTGSGQGFAAMLKQQSVSKAYATEGYAPNLAMARYLLEPLGVIVYEVNSEQLPFANDELELISNRHGSYDPQEVMRVLKPGHLFITQQVGDQTNLRIHELLGTQKHIYFYEGAPQRSTWNLGCAVDEMGQPEWDIVEQKEHISATRFYDLGALVYYLKAIPWEVPDFSIDKYFDKLVEIHRLFEREGFIDVPFHTFFIIAHKI